MRHEAGKLPSGVLNNVCRPATRGGNDRPCRSEKIDVFRSRVVETEVDSLMNTHPGGVWQTDPGALWRSMLGYS